ncbi:unnamed protein product [Amoebophrya sp. A25]|nr:unnamed protein product [Amoebophrya sp. A25]|eukprot:GSA25T00001297001.1
MASKRGAPGSAPPKSTKKQRRVAFEEALNEDALPPPDGVFYSQGSQEDLEDFAQLLPRSKSQPAAVPFGEEHLHEKNNSSKTSGFAAAGGTPQRGRPSQRPSPASSSRKPSKALVRHDSTGGGARTKPADSYITPQSSKRTPDKKGEGHLQDDMILQTPSRQNKLALREKRNLAAETAFLQVVRNRSLKVLRRDEALRGIVDWFLLQDECGPCSVPLIVTGERQQGKTTLLRDFFDQLRKEEKRELKESSSSSSSTTTTMSMTGKNATAAADEANSTTKVVFLTLPDSVTKSIKTARAALSFDTLQKTATRNRHEWTLLGSVVQALTAALEDPPQDLEANGHGAELGRDAVKGTRLEFAVPDSTRTLTKTTTSLSLAPTSSTTSTTSKDKADQTPAVDVEAPEAAATTFTALLSRLSQVLRAASKKASKTILGGLLDNPLILVIDAFDTYNSSGSRRQGSLEARQEEIRELLRILDTLVYQQFGSIVRLILINPSPSVFRTTKMGTAADVVSLPSWTGDTYWHLIRRHLRKYVLEITSSSSTTRCGSCSSTTSRGQPGRRDQDASTTASSTIATNPLSGDQQQLEKDLDTFLRLKVSELFCSSSSTSTKWYCAEAGAKPKSFLLSEILTKTAAAFRLYLSLPRNRRDGPEVFQVLTGRRTKGPMMSQDEMRKSRLHLSPSVCLAAVASFLASYNPREVDKPTLLAGAGSAGDGGSASQFNPRKLQNKAICDSGLIVGRTKDSVRRDERQKRPAPLERIRAIFEALREGLFCRSNEVSDMFPLGSHSWQSVVGTMIDELAWWTFCGNSGEPRKNLGAGAGSTSSSGPEAQLGSSVLIMSHVTDNSFRQSLVSLNLHPERFVAEYMLAYD